MRNSYRRNSSISNCRIKQSTRKTILVLFLFVVINKAYSQDQKIDSLIKMLNNDQLCMDGNIIGPAICLWKEPPLTLHTIGKPASKKLCEVLEDSTRGIIAHVILTWIWNRSGLVESFFIDKIRVGGYKYNGLLFFIDDTEVFANKDDLRINKLNWQYFIQNNTP